MPGEIGFLLDEKGGRPFPFRHFRESNGQREIGRSKADPENVNDGFVFHEARSCLPSDETHLPAALTVQEHS